jgi:hypothetical protein
VAGGIVWRGVLLSTKLTVAGETPATRATSRIVARAVSGIVSILRLTKWI